MLLLLSAFRACISVPEVSLTRSAALPQAWMWGATPSCCEDMCSCFGGNVWTLSCRHRHIFVIQVLVLQHEDSDPTEWLPYLSVLFSPVQVIEFWGRAAKRDPPCKPEECVYHWWKERRQSVSEILKTNV